MITVWVVKAAFAYIVLFHVYRLFLTIWRSP